MSRRVVDRRGAGETAVYGVNTGFGALAEVRISSGEVTRLQQNLVRSLTGAGPEPRFGMLNVVREDAATRLQDRLPPGPFRVVAGLFRDELGVEVGDVFADLDPAPVASASIATAAASTKRNLLKAVPLLCSRRRRATWESSPPARASTCGWPRV